MASRSHLDPDALGGGKRLLCLPIRDELDAEQQPLAACVPEERKRVLKRAQTFDSLLAASLGVAREVTLERLLQRGEAYGTRNWIARKCVTRGKFDALIAPERIREALA